MLEKKINSSSIENLTANASKGENNDGGEVKNDAWVPVAPTEPHENFPVGTKFFLNGKSWFVTKSWIDSGQDRRHLSSASGDEEVVTIETLRKDMNAGYLDHTFHFMVPTQAELTFMLAQKK